MAKPRIISVRMESVNVQQEIDLVARRQRVFGILVREVMDTEGLDWSSAKLKLIKELELTTLKARMSNLKTV